MKATTSLLTIAMGIAIAGAACASATAATIRDISYDRGSLPPHPLKRLDVHVPSTPSSTPRPVVVMVHGGAWHTGDKKRFESHKAMALTDAGYIVANINYRLSPDPEGEILPGRIRHPAHAQDVAQAVGWVHDEIARFGGDPQRIALLGHSAGAHLVSLVGTDHSYLAAAGVPRTALRAVVSLDTEAYDIRHVIQTSRPDRRRMYTAAFGTAAEEQHDPRWQAASPLTHADPTDPPVLVVTQSQAKSVERRRQARHFALALGQQPSDVLTVPYKHGEISSLLGSATDDTAGLTASVLNFLAARA